MSMTREDMVDVVIESIEDWSISDLVGYVQFQMRQELDHLDDFEICDEYYSVVDE
jgi:hypothetical protein